CRSHRALPDDVAVTGRASRRARARSLPHAYERGRVPRRGRRDLVARRHAHCPEPPTRDRVAGMSPSAAPPFAGFPREARDWFRGITATNSRDWFQANRPTYDRCVRQPLESLLAELERYGEGKVFRPNRDTRFAKDKSPYKTNAAAVIPRPGG